jgi:hypothetical protein
MSLKFTRAAWKARIGDPVAKIVLLKMADFADENGQCYPRVKTICEETELSERTVQSKLRLLESMQTLVSIRGVNRCDYTLNLDAINALSEAKTPRESCTPQEAHPAGDAPRISRTPQELHPYPAGAAPLPRRSCTPTPQEMQLHIERPINDQLTTIEPLYIISRNDALIDVPASAPNESTSRDSDAAEIYELYPLKVGRASAIKAIKKALTKATKAQLLEAVADYAKIRGKAPYTPHASTWFNQERWLDDRATWDPNSNSQNASSNRLEEVIDMSGVDGF